MDHKFSPSAKKADKIAVDTLFEYFKDNNNPFDFYNDKITNFVTGEFTDSELTENLINIFTTGEGVYSELKSSQLVKLFDPITKTKVAMKSDELEKAPNINKEKLAFMKTIDFARLTGYNPDFLLHHELTSTSFYLI